MPKKQKSGKSDLGNAIIKQKNRWLLKTKQHLQQFGELENEQNFK